MSSEETKATGRLERSLEDAAAETHIAIVVREKPLPSGTTRETLYLRDLAALTKYLESTREDFSKGSTGQENQDHLVILIHGINTRAHWMGEIKPALERAGFVVAPTSYGKFGVPRFLSPFRRSRLKTVDRVVSDINTAIRLCKRRTGREPGRKSLISHSFGTYVVSHILSEHPEFTWYRIIFCGSVVRDDFDFAKVVERFDDPLLNEVGTRDFWPAMGESAGWAYGSVGSSGFNRPAVFTRWHHGYSHSDFLTEDFCNKFWVPFLRGDKPQPADKAANMPLWIRAIAWLPLRWILPPFLLLWVLLPFLVVLGVLFLAVLWFVPDLLIKPH